jgi:hypothetical protein
MFQMRAAAARPAAATIQPADLLADDEQMAIILRVNSSAGIE